MASTYGRRLSEIRNSTSDPAGGVMSQARLGELISRSVSYVGNVESGKIARPGPDVVNRVAEVLRYSVADQLRDQGYKLQESQPMSNDERELIEVHARLTAPLRRALLATARALLSSRDSRS